MGSIREETIRSGRGTRRSGLKRQPWRDNKTDHLNVKNRGRTPTPLELKALEAGGRCDWAVQRLNQNLLRGKKKTMQYGKRAVSNPVRSLLKAFRQEKSYVIGKLRPL